jgi:fructosamine-3-kinase
MAAIDIEQPAELIAYLRRTRRIAAGEHPQMRCLQGGVSNRTVWLQHESGAAWVVKQALNKLRVTVDWFSDPVRIHREALGLQWLQQLAPAKTIPELIFEDHQYHILAMSAVPLPHENWKTMLLAGDLQHDHVRQFGYLLGTIHKNAWENREQLKHVFADCRFFESLRLEPYYSYTASQVDAAAVFIHALIDDTRAQQLTLVHGDYSPKNVLIYQDRLILLDYEVIHYGDPGFDLGFSLTHLLSKAHHLPAKRTAFAQAAMEYWKTYRHTLGAVPWADTLEARAVRHTLACLLARVAGRSPLEYLNLAERRQQRKTVLQLIRQTPVRVEDLVENFITHLNNH